MAKFHLKKYWMAGTAKTHKSVLYSLRRFLAFRKSRNEQIAEWGVDVVLIFFVRRRTALLEKYDLSLVKCINSKSKAKNPPKSHLRSYVSAFRKFVRITGISYLGQSDCEILHIGAEDWGIAYQRQRKQAGKGLSQPYQRGGIRFGL